MISRPLFRPLRPRFSALSAPIPPQVHRFQDYAAALDGTVLADGAEDPPEGTEPGHGPGSRWIRESEVRSSGYPRIRTHVSADTEHGERLVSG